MNARGIDFTGIAMLIGIGIAGYVGYRLVKGAPDLASAVRGTIADGLAVAQNAVGTAIDAVTPTNPGNIFNRGANAATAALTGDPSMTPGLWIENLFRGSPGENSGERLLAQFTAFDQEDADQGAAGRQLSQHMTRRPDLYWTAADQDDADLGFAMSSASGAAFVDYSRLARGVFK